MKKITKLILVLFTLTSILSTTIAQAATLEEIKERGSIVVGLNAEYPPFEWVELVDGETQYFGIDIELGQAIADEIGVDLIIDNRAFDALIPALQTNKIDIIISGMVANEEREQQVDFSIPYFVAVSQFAVGIENIEEYKTLEDMTSLRIGVLKGSIQEAWVKEEMPEADPVSVNKNGDLLEMLKSKKVDAISMSDLSLAQYLVHYGDSVALVEDLDIANAGVGSAVAVAKDNEALVELIDKVITDLIESGKMDEIFDNNTQKAGESLED